MHGAPIPSVRRPRPHPHTTLRVAALTFVALLALPLAACSTGSPGDEPSRPEVSDPAHDPTEPLEGENDTGCIADRMWSADIDSLAQQLGERMSETGLTIRSSTGSGSMETFFGEDTLVTSAIDVTFTLTVQVQDGPVMVMTQHQRGGGYGSWFWDGERPNVIVFEDWNDDFAVEMTMSVDGETVETPIELPPTAAGGSTMTATCAGNTLVTTPEGSPFIQYWDATEG